MNKPVQTQKNMNKPPLVWVCNAYLDHNPEGQTFTFHTPKTKTEVRPCLCVVCLEKIHGMELFIGEPVQVHKDFPVELLVEKGMVGCYEEAPTWKDIDLSGIEEEQE